MADETRVQVLNEEGRRAQTQSFMWLFRSGEDGLAAIILYGYSPTRSRQPCKGVPGKATVDTWKRMDIRGYNQSPRDQTLLLLGAYPSILHRCRSQRKTV